MPKLETFGLVHCENVEATSHYVSEFGFRISDLEYRIA